MFFAVVLCFLLLSASPPPLLLWLPAVLCHLRCCACHIFTACAVVPGVSPRFERACFSSGAVLLSSLPLLLPGFWLRFRLFRVCVVLLVWWVAGLLVGVVFCVLVLLCFVLWWLFSVASGVLCVVRFFVGLWLILVVVLCGFYSWCLFLMCLGFVGFCWWAVVPLWLLVLLVRFCRWSRAGFLVIFWWFCFLVVLVLVDLGVWFSSAVLVLVGPPAFFMTDFATAVLRWLLVCFAVLG